MPVEQRTPAEYLEALKRHNGSRVAVAKEFNVGVRHVFKMIEILRKRGEEIPSPGGANIEQLAETINPLHNVAPEGFTTKGVSSYHGPEGDLRGFWVKTNTDHDKQTAMAQAAAEALAETIPAQCPIPPPAPRLDKLCNLYTITDYHVGMLAWRQEGGADWDLDIAERTLIGCFRSMIANSPPARLGIVNQLGDFLHTDGFQPLTPTSKHVLDADSRFPKIVKIAVRTLRAVVNIALSKHERVHVLMAEGNHSPASDVWLRELFSALYENEPRITVERSPLPYYAFQHGRTMLAFHHGHLKKVDAVRGVIAAQFPEIWGATTKRYCHMGHLHHTHEKEDAGMTVVQHPTLAARDAYAARGGWYADRGARAITYHEDFGEVGRVMVTPEMLDVPL